MESGCQTANACFLISSKRKLEDAYLSAPPLPPPLLSFSFHLHRRCRCVRRRHQSAGIYKVADDVQWTIDRASPFSSDCFESLLVIELPRCESPTLASFCWRRVWLFLQQVHSQTARMDRLARILSMVLLLVGRLANWFMSVLVESLEADECFHSFHRQSQGPRRVDDHRGKNQQHWRPRGWSGASRLASV